jgi:apolipoprotein N-acyltransferase
VSPDALPRRGASALKALAPLLASALLLALFARGGAAWPLGFVALWPWLLQLERLDSARATALSAWAMSVLLSLTAFSWLGEALARYTGLPPWLGLLLLALGAPLFQPQVLVFALLRRWAAPLGPVRQALAGAAAWVGAEWLLPRLLDDTLGYGLYPSVWLRQAADLGGTAGLTVLLLLSHEALLRAWLRRRDGLRALVMPLGAAAALPLALAGYGAHALSTWPDATAPAAGQPLLRVALVQSNLADYEARRREHGAAAVVREVLDTHYAMSHDAVTRQRADAVLWSETVYPTTFGQPKSLAGALLDQEILDFVDAAGVPFVLGTYERDAAGEYNSAAVVAPRRGLLGHYRKTRPFPLTETVPAWLDGPWLRAALPWTGHWRAGDGARVFPLLLADGREVPVQPLICLDALDTRLSLDAARQGAQALLTLSNDSWFDADGPGPMLHLAAAAFRSVETRLPQYRVATTGLSAVIDATGEVRAVSRLGERALVVGALPVGPVPATLVVRWGDWVGPAGLALLAALALARTARALTGRLQAAPAAVATLPRHAALLPGPVRVLAALLRLGARAGLLAVGALVLLGDSPVAGNTLAQLRSLGAWCLLPEAAAWALMWAWRARLTLEPGPEGALHLRRGHRHLALPLSGLSAVQPWRLPLPTPGVQLHGPGRTVPLSLAVSDPWALARALQAAGAVLPTPAPADPLARSLYSRLAVGRPWLAHPLLRLGLFPLLLAAPAFRLHQHIAYGSGWGEWQAFGPLAWALSFALWWGAWALAVLLCSSVLRGLTEAALLLTARARPGALMASRLALERATLVLLYGGLPLWLLSRVMFS